MLTLPKIHSQNVMEVTTLSTVRPVWARERRLLEYYDHTALHEAVVWRGGRHQYYYVDGTPLLAPSLAELCRDSSELRAYLAQFDDYDTMDLHLMSCYREILEPCRPRLEILEREAFDFPASA